MRRDDPYIFNAKTQSPFGLLLPIMFMVGLLLFSFYAIKGLLTILSFVAPVLLILTFFIDREVITSYVKWVGRLLKENTIVGILAVVLSVVGFHVVSGFLFARALLRRQFRKVADRMEEERDGKLVDYEEVVEEENFLDLPEPQAAPRRSTTKRNDYEDLFD
jgi:hypothetical protein